MFSRNRTSFVLPTPRYLAAWIGVLILVLLPWTAVFAQTGGQGAIQGTVTDSSGAVVANARVIATNVDTGVKTERPTSSGGIYDISPLQPGNYTVEVQAQGFETHAQQNIQVNALEVFGLNVKLSPGSQNETVTVTGAPPALDTTSATHHSGLRVP
jgi:hypothetical protein